MYQTQIQFFFPLTEQIPLDLDYTGCDTQSLFTISAVNGSTGLSLLSTNSNMTWTTVVKSDEVETKQLSIVLDKTPNGVVKWLYKLLNINWKV
jgi:hypothetical protein